MAKWKNIFFWTIGLSVLIIISAFSGNRQKAVRVKGLTIDIDYTDNVYFVTSSEVEEMVKEEYPFLDSLFLQEINIPLLEESIDNHPSIRKAEVYSKLDGSLRVKVYQKLPVARVINSGTAFYIDETGDTMQLSANYSARVPLVSGKINREAYNNIFRFLTKLQSDEFYKDFFSGVRVGHNGEWILYPKPGNHTVLVGKPENLQKKMMKLKTFYQNVVDSKNIDSIKTINLEYTGQVICRKH